MLQRTVTLRPRNFTVPLYRPTQGDGLRSLICPVRVRLGEGADTRHPFFLIVVGGVQDDGPIKAKGDRDAIHDLMGSHSYMRLGFHRPIGIYPCLVPVWRQAPSPSPLTLYNLVHIKGLLSFEHKIDGPPELLCQNG